jgi:hypothetical protein
VRKRWIGLAFGGVVALLGYWVFSSTGGLESWRRAPELSDVKDALNSGEFSKALAILEPLEKRGDQDAIWIMGDIYANGWGVERDRDEANRFYARLSGTVDREDCPNATRYGFAAYSAATKMALSSKDDSVFWLDVATKQGVDINNCMAKAGKMSPAEIKAMHEKSFPPEQKK